MKNEELRMRKLGSRRPSLSLFVIFHSSFLISPSSAVHQAFPAARVTHFSLLIRTFNLPSEDMSIVRKYRIYHILFWVSLFALWHFFRYQDYDRKVGFWITAVKVADLALLVYITNYVLIPKLLYKKKYWLFGSIFLVMVVTSSIIKMYILGQLLNIPNIFSMGGGLKGRFYDNVLPHILLVCTGAAFKLLLDQVRTQRKLVELAKEKSEAELNFLKSQINPHLNSILDFKC